MADVGIGIARTLIDTDGDSIVDSSANALKVTLVDSDNINIGNVVLQTDGGLDIYSSMAVTDAIPNLDQGTLLGTHALLSARKDSNTTIGLTCLDSTHNALHVAISDGTGIASVDGDSNLNVILAENSGVDIGHVDVTSISAGTNAIGKVGHDVTGMTHGTNADVDTTAEQLDGSTSGLDVACKRVDLMASPANSGKIYVGGSDTIGAATGGMQLEAGDFYSIDIDNLNQIWVEASIADQALKYIYYT